MSTYTKTQASTISRTDLLIRQINLIVQSTTGSASFKSIIQKCIENQWVENIKVNGLSSDGKIRQQIVMEIDWAKHQLRMKSPGQQMVEVNIAASERNWLSVVIGQIIDGFNEIKDQGGLEAEWTITYAPEAKSRRAELNKLLGLQSLDSREWEDGKREYVVGQYSSKKLDELGLSWQVVTK